MKKKFECIVRHMGHDVPVEKLGGVQQSSELFLDLSGSPTPRSKKAINQKHDVAIVAGKNLGVGRCDCDVFKNLKGAGTTAVIADSFSRDFYRGAINHGIAVIESAAAYELLSDGEMISIDLECGEIRAQQGFAKINPIPDIHFKIYLAGGLIPYIKKLYSK